MRINDYLFLSIVVIFCILWIYDGILKEYIKKRQKPKFRPAEYGWAEYYSPYLNVGDHFIYGQILIKKENFIL